LWELWASESVEIGVVQEDAIVLIEVDDGCDVIEELLDELYAAV
jgi:hypothetical protein